MASADILRAARARIEDPKNWTQGAFARNSKGDMVASCEPEAVCWCAVGALNAERWADKRVGPLLKQVSEQLFCKSGPSIVNDELGHAAVLQMYDAAIAAAEAEAGR